MKKVFFGFAAFYLGVLVLFTLLGPLIFSDNGFTQNVDLILQTPSLSHWMGTDALGRDLFLRILLGARVSLLIGAVTAVLTLFVGFVYGALAGWNEGWIDRILMRISDLMLAIPSFVLVSVLCLSMQLVLATQDPHLSAVLSLCLAISLTHWMSIARVTRGMILEIKRKPFIEAAIALGATRRHILIKHILPNILGTLLVLMALQVPANILYESFMSFIGLGIHPPQTSWGILVREGWKMLSTFPHLILFPSAVLFLTVWSFHILIDKFRDQRAL